MGVFFIIGFAFISVWLVIILFSRQKTEGMYYERVRKSENDKENSGFSDYLNMVNADGWGKKYAVELSLSDEEKALFNYIGENVYYGVLCVGVLRRESILLFLSVLRKNAIKPDSFKKALAMFHYGAFFLAKKYIYVLFSESVISDIRSELSIKEMSDIRKEVKGWRGLTSDEEKAFFSEDTERWKYFFNRLVDNYTDCELFYRQVVFLESLNESGRVKEYIYSKAYRSLIKKEKGKKDKIIVLKLYIHYLDLVLKAGRDKYYKISNANMKKLFSTEDQKNAFNCIIEQFISSKDIGRAFEDAENLFIIKKKKILLDDSLINSARSDLNKVVNLLYNYLDDEDDNTLSESVDNQDNFSFNRDIVYIDFLRLFIDSGYKLSRQDVELFAQKKGVFPDSLTDGLNERLYEETDDFVIEEDENGFILNKSYSPVFRSLISIN